MHNLVAIPRMVFSIDLHYCCSLPAIVGGRLPQRSLYSGWRQGSDHQWLTHPILPPPPCTASLQQHLICTPLPLQVMSLPNLPPSHSPTPLPSIVWASSSPLRDHLSMPVHDDFPRTGCKYPRRSSGKWRKLASSIVPRANGLHLFTWYPNHQGIGDHVEISAAWTLQQYQTATPCHIYKTTAD